MMLQFVVEKDQRLPHSQLIVQLPFVHPSFDHFIAKVVDVSPSITVMQFYERGVFSIAIIGRRDDTSSVLMEDEVTMDPYAPQFPIQDIDITMNNITLKVVKNEKFVQDLFLVEYRQLEPDKRYPVLEVLDIAEQKNLEIYIGNLNPGQDYIVKVIAVKSGLRSRPWSVTLSTKPNSVSNLTVSETGISCLTLDWKLPVNSGADSFLIRYSKMDVVSNTSVTLPRTDRSVHLCNNIVPGYMYIISIIVKKGLSQSEEKTVSYTVRPLSPEDFKIFPDITKGKYRLMFGLNSTSYYDGCRVSVVSETLEKIEQSEKCSILLPLFPGDRFEFTVSTFSHNVSSSKLHRSVVLTPAFDMAAFGLNLQELGNGVELSWPQSDVFMARIKDIWSKERPASQLQMRLFPTDGVGKGRRLHGDPYNASSLYIGSLRKGSCYKIQIFTVTKSGIVSETRFNEYFRMSAPGVNMTVHSITQTSAILHLVFLSDVGVFLNVVVIDMHGHVVLDKTQKAHGNVLSEIKLNGLRPYHKYSLNAKITCSSGPLECKPAVRSLRQLSFSTMQDKPGPVLSASVSALNPYSVQMKWLPPALPNGILTHYVISNTTKYTDTSEDSRSVIVGTATNRSDHFLETVIDGLSGGERYNFVVRAVTEAGPGEPHTTWMQVQRFEVWPLYTAAVDEPKSRAVGVDQSCGDLPLDTVCNGPLKAATNYKFKLRLFTAPNLFSDTDFSEVVVTGRIIYPSFHFFSSRAIFKIPTFIHSHYVVFFKMDSVALHQLSATSGRTFLFLPLQLLFSRFSVRSLRLAKVTLSRLHLYYIFGYLCKAVNG
uniref:Protein-tyrosine-phosphatase n=1 Tax=Angiostrongylus cantonensis TaxID=6313 RepID=A0A158P6K0_ANGCA